MAPSTRRKSTPLEGGGVSNTPVQSPFQVFLNTTSREQLIKEFRIHSSIADKIVDGRPYASEVDVLERAILPKRAYERLWRGFLSRRDG